jgi:hypothetical protein
MFAVLTPSLLGMIEMGVRYDGAYIVSMMTAIEEQCTVYESSAHHFIFTTLNELVKKCVALFDKFVVTQNAADQNRMSKSKLLKKPESQRKKE